MKEGYGSKTAWPMQGDAERSSNVTFLSDGNLILDIYWVAHELLLSMDKKKKKIQKATQ